MSTPEEEVFKAQIAEALKVVKVVLDSTKLPAAIGDTPHTYDNKYTLVERATKSCIASLLNALTSLGATAEAVDQMVAWNLKKQAVSLRLVTFVLVCVFFWISYFGRLFCIAFRTLLFFFFAFVFCFSAACEFFKFFVFCFFRVALICISVCFDKHYYLYQYDITVRTKNKIK
jgi:hypothetical protein